MNTEIKKTATFIRELGAEFRGDARLYKLDPPIEDSQWSDGVSKYEYVIVSGVEAMFSGPETLIFPSDEQGNVVDWGDLDGSFRGDIDHERALNEAGYKVK